MARFTSDELAIMRGARPDGRRRILHPRGVHLSVADRIVVYSGQVDGAAQADAQTLGYHAFTAKNTTGDYLDVNPHMTIDLGTMVGGRNLGSVRSRTGVTVGAEVRVAESAPSVFPLANDLYFQIVDEYRPWPVLPRGVGASINGAPYTNQVTMYVDYDRAYSSQNAVFAPKANITRSATKAYAPKPAGWVDDYRSVAPKTYRTVTLSAAFSFTFTTGRTIGFWQWLVGDGTIVTGTDADENITVRFPPGFRYISLRVFDNTGVISNVMRYPIWVHDDDHLPLSHFAIPRDWTGDWREIDLDFFEQLVDETVIPKGTALCVWEDDPFWGQAIPDGYRDQMLGWNKEDVTLFQKNRPRTTLTVTGMGEWLNRARSIPQRIQDPSRTPETWFEMEDITLDRLVFYLYDNFSTGSLIGNLYRSGITDILKSLDLTGSSLLGQMQYAVQGYYGRARFDSLNQLILKRHYAYMDTSERAATETALALTSADHPYDAPLKITRRYYNLVASLLGAGASFNGTTNTIYNARAPGRTPGEGNSEQEAPGQNLPATSSQDQLTRLTACHYQYLNNERDSVPYDLLANLDGLEVAWGEPIAISEVTADSGLSLSGDLFMVKEINTTRDLSADGRKKRISLTLEGVTTGEQTGAQDVIVVVDETDPPDLELPDDIVITPVTPVVVPPYAGDTLPTKLIIFDSGGAHCHISTEWTPALSSLTYVDRSTGLTGVNHWATGNPFNWDEFLALQSTGLFINPSPFTGGTWTLLASPTDISGHADAIFTHIAPSINRNGYYALSTGNTLYYTTNRGASWNASGIPSGTPGYVTALGDSNMCFAISPHNNGADGRIFAIIYLGSGNWHLYRSDDWGATWTSVGSDFALSWEYASINIPFMRSGGTLPNINDASQEIYVQGGAGHSVNTGRILKSSNAGASWSTQYVFGAGGGLAPAGSKTGWSMQTFTHDSDIVLSVLRSLGAGAFGSGLRISVDAGVNEVYSALLFSGAANETNVNGFSQHSQAALVFSRLDASFVWTVDAGVTVQSVAAPSGYGGVGNVQWSLTP